MPQLHVNNANEIITLSIEPNENNIITYYKHIILAEMKTIPYTNF